MKRKLIILIVLMVVGFAGAVIMLRPGFAEVGLGTWLALIAALAMAASVLYSGTNAEAAAAVAAAAAAAGASGPFGSPDAFLSGENIDLTNSGQQPTPAHSLATSPYNPYDDDESDVITPITNNKIRMGILGGPNAWSGT